jgi:hypothetical protein
MKRAGLVTCSSLFTRVFIETFGVALTISPLSLAGMPVYRCSPLILRPLPTRRAGSPQTLVLKIMP